jgi:hypothetical protein
MKSYNSASLINYAFLKQEHMRSRATIFLIDIEELWFKILSLSTRSGVGVWSHKRSRKSVALGTVSAAFPAALAARIFFQTVHFLLAFHFTES